MLGSRIKMVKGVWWGRIRRIIITEEDTAGQQYYKPGLFCLFCLANKTSGGLEAHGGREALEGLKRKRHFI